MIVQLLVLCVVVILLAVFVRALDEVFGRPQPVVSLPVGLFVNQIEGDSMADTLTYEIVVAAPAVRDVVSREVTVLVDGLYNEPVAYPGNAVNLGQITVPQDSKVIVSVTDVDDAGNRSEPATLIFTAVDTVPPPVPGGVSVVLVGENVHSLDESSVEPAVEEAEEEAEEEADEEAEEEADEEADEEVEESDEDNG
jgi:hypothetical protein